MRPYIERRVRETANLFITTQGTVRSVARIIGVSKSTTHLDLTVRLRELDAILAVQAHAILQHNSAIKHVRGGLATRRKRALLREEGEQGENTY
jgi:putative DeoR family transcriptional regulator (stage III sporulation protein D)